MENKQFMLLAVVCVIAHIIRTIYEILKFRKIIKANKIMFVLIFAVMILLWVSWFGLCEADAHKMNFPEFIKYTGLILSFAGVVMFLAALFTIKSLETYEGDLVTRGIYSKVRHPMYLAFIFWLAGFPVFCDSMFALILSLPLIANVLFWRSLEEKELLERFPGYEVYRKRTIF